MDPCPCKPSGGGGRTYDVAGGGARNYRAYRGSQSLGPNHRPGCWCPPRRENQSRHSPDCPCPVPVPSRNGRAVTVETTERRMTEKMQSYEPGDYRTDGGVEDPELCREVERLSHTLDLMEFVAEISLHLSDRGSALRRVMDDEMASYRSLVEDVFATWNKDVCDAAARNQRELRERYQQWTQRLKQRIKANNTWLGQYVPNFDWEQYYDDPHYLTRLFAAHIDGLLIEDENISQWRKQNFHKLYWLREQAKKANAENDRLAQDLDNSRRKNHDQQTLVNMNRELMHEKHAQLQFEVKQLKEERNRLSETMGELFAELESNKRLTSPWN